MLSTKRNNHAIFIEGLPIECMETDLIKLLQPCGKVNAVSMHRHPNPSLPPLRPNSISASVEFQVREHAEAAVYLLETSVIWGRRLSARLITPVMPSPAMSNPSVGMSSGSGNSNSKALRSAQVHISYLTKQLVTIVTEQMILELFSTFGKVIEVSLKKKCVDTEMCIQNGYGFVHYPLTAEGIESALRAVETLHQVTINNISYDCSVSNQLKQVLMSTGRLPAGGAESGHGNSMASMHAMAAASSTANMRPGAGMMSAAPAPTLKPASSSSSWWEDDLTANSGDDRFPSLLGGRSSGNGESSSMFPPLNNSSPNHQSMHHQSHGLQHGFASGRDFNSASSTSLWGGISEASSIGGRISMHSGATSGYVPSVASLDGSLTGNNSSFYQQSNSNNFGLGLGSSSKSFASPVDDLFGGSSASFGASNPSNVGVLGSGRFAPQPPSHPHHSHSHHHHHHNAHHYGNSSGASIGSGRSSHDSQSQGNKSHRSLYSSSGVSNVPLIAEDDLLPSPSSSSLFPVNNGPSNASSKLPGVFNKWF